MQTQPLDLNELVRETIELTRHKWENLNHARGVPINMEVNPQATAWVSASPVELREVLTNLIFNAVDAMPRGGTITIRTWSTAAHVFLSVRDRGVGISEAVRQRLFEPFFTTKGERGNGLGLSVVFGIVQRHSGEIQVDSAVGQGSTFTVRLPATSVRTAAPLGRLSHAFHDAGPKGLRVLVVEDEESIRRFLAAGLSRLGHHAHVTADAEEGLAAFVREPFDVVLTDLGLPGASGEEVARTVARRAPATPVVLLTGWADQLEAEQQSPEGVTRILGKPVTIEKLAATLAAVCPR